MKLNTDCIYFNGDRPCSFHKLDGYICEGCTEYVAIGKKVLVVKLDAQGDVLRTTCILSSLAATLQKGDLIEWVTNPESIALLQHNPYIHKILDSSSLADQRYMAAHRYDVVVSLDASIASSSLVSSLKYKKLYGYFLNEKGKVIPSNPAAAEWQKLGAFDNLKKANQRTYQDWMLDIIGLPRAEHSYVYRITKSERKWAEDKLGACGVSTSGITIGLNTGGGSKWHLKKWREDGFVELARRCVQDIPGVNIVLLGGSIEADTNKRIFNKINHPNVVFPGTDQSLRNFAALLSCLDLVVTGDTLAMHLALASQVPVVVLFGPTSMHEIDVYGIGEKVQADVPCKVCYLQECPMPVTCMDVIHHEDVFAAVQKILASRQTTNTRKCQEEEVLL